MSLFRTTPHTGTASATVSVRKIAAVTLSLLLGVFIGFAMAGLGTDSPGANTGSIGLSNDRFLELNTTALEYPGSATGVPPAVQQEPEIDAFTYWNTVAIDGLVSDEASAPLQASDTFLRWNIDSLEFSAFDDKPATGPR